jgi:hypothetical protein
VQGVRDALRRLDGVDTVHVDLQSNRVTIAPAADVELDLAAIPAAIRRAGFTPADMRLTARGAVGESGGRAVFRIRGWSAELPIRGPPPARGGEVRLEAAVDFERGLVLVPRAP